MSGRICGSHMPLLLADIFFFNFLLLCDFGFNCTVKVSKRVDTPVGKKEKKESK